MNNQICSQTKTVPLVRTAPNEPKIEEKKSFTSSILKRLTLVCNKVRDLNGLPPISLQVLVDYNLSFEDMIKEGKYTEVNRHINSERFPIKGNGKKSVLLKLVHLKCAISSERVIKELDRQGLRPATIEELLAFGATFPHLHQQFPIVALGSIARVDDYGCVVCLKMDDIKRILGLSWFDYHWRSYDRFLAVQQ